MLPSRQRTFFHPFALRAISRTFVGFWLPYEYREGGCPLPLYCGIEILGGFAHTANLFGDSDYITKSSILKCFSEFGCISISGIGNYDAVGKFPITGLINNIYGQFPLRFKYDLIRYAGCLPSILIV